MSAVDFQDRDILPVQRYIFPNIFVRLEVCLIVHLSRVMFMKCKFRDPPRGCAGSRCALSIENPEVFSAYLLSVPVDHAMRGRKNKAFAVSDAAAPTSAGIAYECRSLCADIIFGRLLCIGERSRRGLDCQQQASA